MDTKEILQEVLDVMDAVIKLHKGGLMIAVAGLEIASKENILAFADARRIIREAMEQLDK